MQFVSNGNLYAEKRRVLYLVKVFHETFAIGSLRGMFLPELLEREVGLLDAQILFQDCH